MKIIALTAENIKKLTAVEIRPDGNLVQITGKNGQGKTSVLDSIWWALAGTKHIQAAPIRKDAKEARIRLDLGEIIVTRKFKRTEDGTAYTSPITVENAEGARFPSPQSMLDGLLGALSLDPLAFLRMPAKQQFDALKQFVPDVDFEEIENQQRGDYDRRTDINRKAKDARSAAGLIHLPDDAPTERRDESSLVDKLQKAGEHNAEIEQRRARRDQTARDAADKRSETARYEAQAAELRRQATELDEKAKAALGEAQELDHKLKSAPALPEPIDTEVLRQDIRSAKDHNELVDDYQERKRLLKEAERHEADSKALTARMEQRQADKLMAIAEAKLPVEGLGFGDGAITMNDLPFDQASDAEQLRASIAVAMAMSPKLKVIRVRDGSLLDEDAMALLADMANAADCQVWIERVDGSGSVGFVLEDGHLKEPVPAEAAE